MCRGQTVNLIIGTHSDQIRSTLIRRIITSVNPKDQTPSPNHEIQLPGSEEARGAKLPAVRTATITSKHERLCKHDRGFGSDKPEDLRKPR